MQSLIYAKLTSECLRPHEKQRWLGFADFPPQPLYSSSSVEAYTHLAVRWKEVSSGILPQVTTYTKQYIIPFILFSKFNVEFNNCELIFVEFSFKSSQCEGFFLKSESVQVILYSVQPNMQNPPHMPISELESNF